MATRKVYTLYVDLYENGQLKELGDLSEDEMNAISAEVEELWMDSYQFESNREFLVALNPEEDILYLITRVEGVSAAFPDDCMLREVTIGAPKVNEQTLKLIGDRIPLRLPGYPGRRIEVMVTDI
jgi:hypothetical protein